MLHTQTQGFTHSSSAVSHSNSMLSTYSIDLWVCFRWVPAHWTVLMWVALVLWHHLPWHPWSYIYFKNRWGYKLAATSAGSPETCQHRWDIPWCCRCSPTSSVLCYHHCFPSSEWKLPGRHPSLVFSGSLACIAQQSSHPGQTVRKFLQELLPINSNNWSKCQSNLLVTWSGRGDFSGQEHWLRKAEPSSSSTSLQAPGYRGSRTYLLSCWPPIILIWRRWCSCYSSL